MPHTINVLIVFNDLRTWTLSTNSWSDAAAQTLDTIRNWGTVLTARHYKIFMTTAAHASPEETTFDELSRDLASGKIYDIDMEQERVGA